MDNRDDLERRVAELEKKLATMQATALRGRTQSVRKRASWGLGDLPFYDIAVGPDLARGEIRGHARGVIAIGDIATGFLALGGLARGVVALGGLAVGLLSIGGLSVGLLGAVGGLAIGTVAAGGGAAGGVAIGGATVGYYACGGAPAGIHALGPRQGDPEAEAFFKEYGLERVCMGNRARPMNRR